MIRSKYISAAKSFYLLVMALILVMSGCRKDLEDLDPAKFPAIGEVFIDGFSPGLQYDSYDPAEGANPDAFQVVSDVVYEGDKAMRFAIPDPDDRNGSFAGGTFSVPGGRDLTGFDALTFWMKASKNAIVDLIGFGDEFEFGDSEYRAFIMNASVNSNWKQYIIPLPDPSVLTQEKGMFWISEGTGNDNGLGYTLWIDEVKFEKLGTLAQYRPGIQEGNDVVVQAETGQRIAVTGLGTVVNLPTGEDVTVAAAPGYFDFTSSNTSVATVNNDGVAMVLDAGTAVITASLAGVDASGSLTIEGSGDPVLPLTPAPVPTRDADSVIALWCNVYDERPVDTWNARYEFSNAEEEFIQIAGDDVIRYRNLNFVGIEFKNPTIDASEMTHFHINIWTPDETAGAEFKVLLTDAGPDGTLGTGDDTNDELTFTAPLLQTEEWVTIEIPLSNFTGLASRTRLTQMVLSGTLPNVFVDNVYFYIAGTPPDVQPTSGPPTPTQDPANVISIYSDQYTDVPRLGFNFYGAAAFEEVNLSGDMALKYTLTGNPGGNFQVLELGAANQIDAAAAGMTNFRFDLWFPKAGVETAQFLLKLVDFGSDPPPTASITINSVSTPAIAQGTWLQFDFTLAQLSSLGMTSSGNIQQVVFDLLSSGEVYVDNIYFYKEGGGGPIPPTVGPPAPMQDPADVISIYSDQYTDVPRLGFNFYGAAAFEEVNLSGDMALKYTLTANPGGNFQVIELGADNRIDAEAAGMTNFRFDLWFPNEGVENEQFLLKVVDFGSDPPPTASITINNAVSDPPIAQGMWLQFDYTLAELASLGMTSSGDVQQVVIDLLGSGEVYVDNIYFYKEGGGGGPILPTSGPPAPTQDAADVISIYSDEYTDVPRLGFNFYGAAAFEEVSLSGDMALKYTFTADPGGNFQVLELGAANRIDAAAAGMTNFRFDLWFPNEGVENEQFLLKVVDFGSDPPPTASITINSAVSDPAIAQGTWLQYDYTLDELAALGMTSSSDVQQVVIDLLSSGEVFIDNIYFYKSGSVDEPSLPLDFEGGETLIAFDGGAYAVNVANPDMNGNPSGRVLEFGRVLGAAWYSGVVFDETLRTTPLIDLSNGTVFTMKIWSPKADIDVRFQLEGGVPDPGSTPSYEVIQTVDVANQWVTLTFDFSSQVDPSDLYNKFSIFPDWDPGNQNPVSEEAIYYIDDITQE